MRTDPAKSNGYVFTIGHSNHPPEPFVKLLRGHEIDAIVDTRSRPYSKYAPHFNTDALRRLAKSSGVRYGFMGKELGGRPDEPEFYDAQGHVLYYKLAESPRFLDGVERVLQGIRGLRVALLCSEENPFGCHRRLLVARVLTRRGVEVRHIRGDGTLQVEREIAIGGSEGQPLLFAPEDAEAWKSLRSVSARGPRGSSSDDPGPPESGDGSTCD